MIGREAGVWTDTGHRASFSQVSQLTLGDINSAQCELSRLAQPSELRPIQLLGRLQLNVDVPSLQYVYVSDPGDLAVSC